MNNKEGIIQIDNLIHTEKYRQLQLSISAWIIDNNKEAKCNKLYTKIMRLLKGYSLGEVCFVLNCLEIDNLLQNKQKFLETFERGKLDV